VVLLLIFFFSQRLCVIFLFHRSVFHFNSFHFVYPFFLLSIQTGRPYGFTRRVFWRGFGPMILRHSTNSPLLRSGYFFIRVYPPLPCYPCPSRKFPRSGWRVLLILLFLLSSASSRLCVRLLRGPCSILYCSQNKKSVHFFISLTDGTEYAIPSFITTLSIHAVPPLR
jgi:hypothetical protein